MKTDFEQFAVGTVFNPLSRQLAAVEPTCQTVQVSYPSRLEAMALDPSVIADNNNLIYPAGQIDFSVSILKRIHVALTDQSGAIEISSGTTRAPLVEHAVRIMQQALGVNDGLLIDVDNSLDLRHCGLGSSSSLIAGVAAAINELYGKPLAALEISRYCAQNHGEEVDGSTDTLVPVQCIGGSAISGHFSGGLLVLAGQSTPIARQVIDPALQVVIGVPTNFEYPDAKQLMETEVANIEGFRSAGQKYGPEIAYRLVHQVLPALVEGELKPCKDLIFDYRWDMGSIANCAFTYPPMVEIAEELRDLRGNPKVDILSLSSVGPGFFALTKYPEYVAERFKNLDMAVHHTTIHNDAYGVTHA